MPWLQAVTAPLRRQRRQSPPPVLLLPLLPQVLSLPTNGVGLESITTSIARLGGLEGLRGSSSLEAGGGLKACGPQGRQGQHGQQGHNREQQGTT